VLRRAFLLTVLSVLLSVITTLVAAYTAAVRPKQRTWGIDPAETTKTLPGDDVIADPTIVETRGITIAAPVERIWPWLVQMGYGRGGWYSYDRLDNQGGSSHRIVPQLQHLEVGDVVPTHPGGGFRVESLESKRHLVLSLDPELMKGSEETADGDSEAAEERQTTPRSLEATGKLSDLAIPGFRGSWAFVLEPVDEDHTRLIERFRVHVPAAGVAQKVAMPVLGLGVFAMTRRQLLGIRDRAESEGEEPLPAAA
jgi:hypothetical protein